MKESKGIRKSRGFKSLSSFVTSLFLFTTVLNSVTVTNADTIEVNTNDTVSLASSAYKELDVNWTRTKDVRAGSSFSVHNSINKFDKYWTKSGSTYTMKSYDDIDSKGTNGVDAAKGEEGIFLMQQLFTKDKKTVVFDYDALTKTMGATDDNAWDGKGANPYSQYRHDVVNEYLATKSGDYYHLKDIQNPKNPTTNIKKIDGFTINSYPDFATWQYMKYNNSTRGTEQMRLFQGKFDINEGDIGKYNYYLTAGDNNDNILAVDDTIMVLVDGVPTDINYTTADYRNTTVELRNGAKTYDIKFNQTKNCRKENNLPVTCDINSESGNRDAALSVFTDTLHVHLGDEIQNSINGSKVLGDVTNIINNEKGTNHKIEVIASDYNLSGGMTKLNIVRVAKPTTELVKDAYVGDKLVASSSNGTTSAVKNDDTISYKFTYKNTGDAPLYNILFEDNLLNATIGVKDGKNVVQIAGKTYTEDDVKVEKYNASGTLVKTSNASLLADKNEALKKGEYIVVSSSKMIHVPTSDEIENGRVENTVTTTANYEGYYTEEKITDKAEAKVTVKVQEKNPAIKIVKEAYGKDDYTNLLASSDLQTGQTTGEIAKDQTAYYKFKITNVGEDTLKDINLNDSDLKLSISKTNYEGKNGESLDKSNLVIKKYALGGSEITGVSGLDCLKTLEVGQSIVVYDKSNIIKTNINNTFRNTVNVNGKSSTDKPVKDSATVSVTPVDPQITVTKTAFTDVVSQLSVRYVSVGQKVYYKFTAQNSGDTILNNIKFVDNKFNGKDSVNVTEDGVFINGVKAQNTQVKVSKYDINGIETTGGLELLKSLKVGEKIVFTDVANVYRETVYDEIGKSLSNTVTGYGTYKGAGDDKEVNDNDTAVVIPTLQNITVTKTARIKDSNGTETVVASSENQNINTTIKPGTKVYYTIGFENVGPYKMNNITFDDKTLNIQISGSQIVVKGKNVDPSKVKVSKYKVGNEDSKVEGGLSLLDEDLMPGWKIEVISDDYLNDVKNEDGDIYNEVEGSGKYKTNEDGTSNTLSDTADVDVKVKTEPVVVKPDSAYNKIKIQKQAVVDDKVVTDSEDKTINENVNVGKKINYILTVINNGDYTLKNVTITDEDLDVFITKDNVTKYEAIVKDSKSFKITKYGADGSLKTAGTMANLKDILSELQPKEKIVVSDNLLLSYVSNEPEIKNNKAKTQGEGYEKNPTDETTIKTPIVESNVSINKDVYKITRDGSVIYDKNKDSIDPINVRVYPGDKVQFTYTIKNNTVIKVENLLITDLLQNPDMKEFKDVSDWTFTKDGTKFNDQSFALDAGESIDLLSNEWIVPDNCKRNVINTVNLYQKQSDGTNKFINKDDAKLIVYPRVYVNMDCPSDTNKEFYVTVKGDNGFETSMYIKDKDKVEISDLLDFDINYTITETIPMNFTYKGIDIEKGTDINGNKYQPRSLTFNLMTVTHPENIILHNEKRNSDEFQADSEVTNTLKYVEK